MEPRIKEDGEKYPKLSEVTAGHVFNNLKLSSLNLLVTKTSYKCLALNTVVIVSSVQQNSSNIVEAACFSEATRKHNFTDSVEETPCKRIRQDSRLQSPEISSESESQVGQEDDSQLSTSQENLDNLTR